MRNRGSRPRRRAFSLLELLIVLAIMITLISLLLPSFGRLREMAKRTTCLSQMRQITAAWLNYAADNDNQFVSADTWKSGWVDSGNQDASLRQGALYKYIPNTAVYHCPSDYNALNQRSYSLSARLNGERGWGIPVATRMSQILRPANCILAIEEYDPRGYNVNSFIIYNSGDNWVDFPARWHQGGACLSFVDGRVEYWQWADKRTRELQSFFAVTPNNPDLDRLHQYAGY